MSDQDFIKSFLSALEETNQEMRPAKRPRLVITESEAVDMGLDPENLPDGYILDKIIDPAQPPSLPDTSS